MSNQQNSMPSYMCGVWFDPRLELAQQEAFTQYVGCEQHMSLLRIDDTHFAIRAHDKHTPGGLSLRLEAAAETPPVPVHVAPVIYSGVLPTVFPQGMPAVFLDMDLSSGGDVDLTGWAPAGLVDGSVVQVRKIDGGPARLVFTDHIGVFYSFVRSRGEFITLMWVSAISAFRIA